MQYRDGKKAQKNDDKSFNNTESFRSASGKRAIIPTANAVDTSKSPINITPYFLILSPWLVVNSNFSLSKVIYELNFTSTIAPIAKIQYIKPPNGCGMINPEANAIKNIKPNTRFQKLSLLSLEATKPVCSVAKFCISRALAALLALTNAVKSSISICLYYCSKTYDFSISNFNSSAKVIMQLLIVLPLCTPVSNTMATPVNNRDVADIRALISKAEIKHKIPSGLLGAIAKVESNTSEFAINVGGKATYARTLNEAVTIANTQINAGTQNIDLGVMQLNYRWHEKQFSNLKEMLSPEKNIAYAASLLSSLYKQHGNWQEAIRYYHSANPKYSRKYSRKVTMAWLSN